jgi:hypothetical protein
MNILFEDWFLINIINHANMSTLSNLKFTNKYYSKHITKRNLINQMAKCIKNNYKSIELKYYLTLDNCNFECQPGPIIIPVNTLWKYTLNFQNSKYGGFKFSGEIINAFNKPKIKINEPINMYTKRIHYGIKLEVHNNIIILKTEQKRPYILTTATMTIKSIHF